MKLIIQTQKVKATPVYHINTKKVSTKWLDHIVKEFVKP